MKVVMFGWGMLLVVAAFSCGGKIDGPDGGAAGSGMPERPVACPGPNGDLTKIANKPCTKLYEGCGSDPCQYACVCYDIGTGLRWTCGDAC